TEKSLRCQPGPSPKLQSRDKDEQTASLRPARVSRSDQERDGRAGPVASGWADLSAPQARRGYSEADKAAVPIESVTGRQESRPSAFPLRACLWRWRAHDRRITMKTFFLTSLCLGVALAAPAQTNETGFVSIFDGNSLAGWHVIAKTGHSGASGHKTG